MTLIPKYPDLDSPGCYHLETGLSALEFIRQSAPYWWCDRDVCMAAPLHFPRDPEGTRAALDQLEKEGVIWSMDLTYPAQDHMGRARKSYQIRFYWSATRPFRARVVGTYLKTQSIYRRVYRSRMEVVELHDTAQGWTAKIENIGPNYGWRHGSIQASSLFTMTAALRDLHATRGQASLFGGAP